MPAETQSYSKAVGAYGSTAATGDPRSLEAHVLLKSAHQLEALSQRLNANENVSFIEIGEVLDFNQKLWTIFASDAADPQHTLPQEIKNNIASLGLFIFKRTNEVRAYPSAEKLQVLININRNIAAGLSKQATHDSSQKSAEADATSPKTTEKELNRQA